VCVFGKKFFASSKKSLLKKNCGWKTGGGGCKRANFEGIGTHKFPPFEPNLTLFRTANLAFILLIIASFPIVDIYVPYPKAESQVPGDHFFKNE
jgi:hypothetical protein